MRLVKFSYVLAICALLVFKPSAVIGFDVYEEMVASNYNFSAWCDAENTLEENCIYDWHLPELTLQTNSPACGFVKTTWDIVEKLNIYETQRDKVVLNVWAVVATNGLAARMSVIEKMASCTSTIKWLPYTNGVGTVAFYYPFGTNVNALIFSRNNIMISIDSHADYISTTNVAHQIDADILSKSQND